MGFCDLMESLSCPEHLGSPGVDSDYKTVDDNISCEEMCELYIDAITLDCYNNVTTCDELRECE